MIHMAVELFFQNGKKDQHPIKMLHALNKTLGLDSNQKIGLCLLLLNPDKDQLSFISCDYTSLWHIPEGSKKSRVLATPNPPLGLDPAATLLETADNWNSGDTLILRSLGAALAKPDGVEEVLLLSPQH